MPDQRGGHAYVVVGGVGAVGLHIGCEWEEQKEEDALDDDLITISSVASQVDREKLAAYIEDKLRQNFSKRQQHLLSMGAVGGGGGGGGGLIQGVIESAVGSELHHHHHLPMSVHTTS